MAFRKDGPDNTLRVILNSTPIEEVSISNVNLGTSFASNGQPSALPSGKTEAILIDGKENQIALMRRFRDRMLVAGNLGALFEQISAKSSSKEVRDSGPIHSFSTRIIPDIVITLQKIPLL